MVNEAERFAGEDKSKREAVETKNNAESMVYQTEKQIKELGDKVRHLAARQPLTCEWLAQHPGDICTAALFLQWLQLCW